MTDASGTPWTTDRSPWPLVAGASLVSVGLGAYEISPASVTPLITADLGVDQATAGLIVGIMFGTAVVASLPAGAVLDRTNSRTAVALAVAGLVVAGTWGWAAARAGALRWLLASRVLGGVAYVVVWNAAIDIVGEAAPPGRRATAVGAFTASGPVGFALGQGAGPVVARAFGWPAIFLAYVGVTLAGLAVFWPASRGLGRVGAAGPPDRAAVGAVLRNRGVWLVGAVGFLGYAVYLFVNTWATSYLTDELHIALGLSGVLAALFPAVGVVSRASSGALSDRVFDGRRRPLVVGSFVLAAPLVAVLAVSRTLAVLVAALLLAGFAVQLTLGLSFAYVGELVEPRVAATAVAFQTAAGLAGAALAPAVGGAVIDAAGYEAAFLACAGVAALGVLAAWLAPEPGG